MRLREMDEALAHVARQQGLVADDMMSSRRYPVLARGRRVLWLIGQKLGYSPSAMARWSGFDRTSITYGLSQVTDRDVKFAEHYVANKPKKVSVANEIIEINDLLQGSVKPEAHGKHEGRVVSIGLNRLAILAEEASAMLASRDEKGA